MVDSRTSGVSWRTRLRARWLESLLLVGLAVVVIWFGIVGYEFLPEPAPTPTPLPGLFDGARAYADVNAQVGFGARPTGSQQGIATGDYIIAELEKAGWQVEIQPFVYQGVQARNIIGKGGTGPVVILGAHYDTRLYADSDPDPELRLEPVMGANDGASGVAVLLELGRVLDKEQLANQVWLTFFDAEDNGGIDGWEFIAGSRYMAAHLTITPQAVIVVDMIGDADQQIYKERNSTPELQDQIFDIAGGLGLESFFISELKWSMLDDHTPFLERGFTAADLIDFDYPYWHTTEDTADKVSADSLKRVGVVLQAFLEGD